MSPRRWWIRWVELLDRRETGEILAVFRILAGLSLVATVADVVLAGAVDVIWIDAADGGYRHLGRTSSWLIDLLGGPSPEVVWMLVGVAILGGLFLAVGLGGRITALACAQAMLALSMINSHTKGSYDALLSNALWLLVLADSTATWSLDARLRTGRFCTDREVPAWPRYLAIVQIVVMYFFNAIQKVSASWTFAGGFSALYYILQQPTWQRFDHGWAASVYPLTQVATAITWFFELFSPLLLLVLWFRATADRPGRIRRRFNRFDLRIPFAVTGFLLHAGIYALMDVGTFSFIVLSFYPCLFSPADLRRLTLAQPRASTV